MLKIRDKEYYKVKDLVKILGFDKQTIYSWINSAGDAARKKGDLIPSGKHGRDYIFTLEELKRSSKTKVFFEETE